jgi:hypothetical protein
VTERLPHAMLSLKTGCAVRSVAERARAKDARHNCGLSACARRREEVDVFVERFNDDGDLEHGDADLHKLAAPAERGEQDDAL